MALHKIANIGRTYRHVQRYGQILSVLFKYGFGDLVDSLKIEQYLEIGLQMISRKRREQIETLSRAARVPHQEMLPKAIGRTLAHRSQR